LQGEIEAEMPGMWGGEVGVIVNNSQVGISGAERRNRKGIGSHAEPNEGLETVWLTPPQVLHNLGEFDLDPCAAPEPRPWATARQHITLPEDGLNVEWVGRVWLNPPYDADIHLWLKKMAYHRQGTALIFARTEIDAWQKWVWPKAKSVLFIAGRLFFHYPDGTRSRGNAGGPSALVAYSDKDTDILGRSGIAGKLVFL
jgi:hypothetical protein